MRKSRRSDKNISTFTALYVLTRFNIDRDLCQWISIFLVYTYNRKAHEKFSKSVMAAYTTITKKEKKKERKAWYLKHSLSYFLKENDTRINDTYTHRYYLE